MNQNSKGILALALVTALSFGVIAGSRALTIQPEGNTGTSESTPAASTEELDVSGFDGIRSAVRYLDNNGETAGYMVTAAAKGYASDVVCEVSFSADGQTVLGVKVVEQQETEQVGTKVTEPDFLNQFQNVTPPVYLPGMAVAESSKPEQEPVEDFGELQDGEYEASGEADSNGFVPTVKMTVSGGKITAVSWDETNAEGKTKSEMSENGEYTMTEDGPTWAAQSKALADALIASQSLSTFTMDENGKTDAVSGISISIAGFVNLAEQCMKEASGQAVKLNDGEYEASGEADSNGFVPTVKMTVSGGKITAVSWDETNADGKTKSQMSENGEYTMTEDGPTWAAQSKALADALIASQSLSTFTMDENGKTDAVSGVSISIAGFVNLAEQCMKEASGQAVKLNDGEYEASGEADSNGFVPTVKMTVSGGKITAVNWDETNAEGKTKSQMSENGEYTMTEDGPTWAAQSKALADALIASQSLSTFTMDENGKTDAVSGVSISIAGFVNLAEQCIAQASGEEVPEPEEPAAPQEGTQIDAVSGATFSSTAVVKAVNLANEFLESIIG